MGNKKRATCLATLLQNKLNSNVVCITTHVKPVLRQIRLLTGLLLTTCSAAILQNKLHVFTEALLWFQPSGLQVQTFWHLKKMPALQAT